MGARITIKVVGAVARMGDYHLSAGASVSAAIRKAGGFAVKPYPPTGIITVRSRRKSDGLYYCRRMFDAKKVDPRGVCLRDLDSVIVQVDVSEA